ncbi:MAG TPA: response regulator [Kofleriaceae bacterium]|jgi:two-component system chemotaxis sensor kinase CheA
MEKDPYRYFRPEATELVGQLSTGLVELEKSGSDAALVAKLFRVAHTLKGAARIVKHREIAELAHALETWMAPLRDGGAVPARVDEALALVDKMSTHVGTLGAPPRPATQPLPVKQPDAPQRVSFERVDLGGLLDGLADLQVQVAQLRTLDDPRHLPGRIDQIEREVRHLREETEQLQLIPAGSLFPMLTRVVRDVAAPVDLVGKGGETRLEAGVLSVLHGALVQLVRNAIAHGIEPTAERRAAGKPDRATITVEISQLSGRVSVRVSDDGRGIDLAAVRRALIDKGLAAPALDDRDALIRALIAGGVSTATTVSELSGRGVGLDVVRDAARELGGELVATTNPGKGTTFTLSLPVSMSTLQVIMLSAGPYVAAVPLASVTHIVAARAERIVSSERATVLVHDDASLPYATLARLVGSSATAATSVAIIDRGDGELVALGAERVLGVKEVVQRARPPGATLDPIVAGLVIDDAGIPRPVLDPMHTAKAIRATRVLAAPEKRKRLPILVIDDSLTTRMLEQSILESAGYEVELASNAEEGLAKAQRNRYALFLVDVEMPGMDGFTFVATTRAHAELSKVPAILVTSRNAPEDLRRGADAGAKGYIVKGEFDQNELLALIGKLT